MTNQLTKSEFMKAVNAVAAKLEGHRDARLKEAWAIVKNGRFTEVSKLISPSEILTAIQAPNKPKAAKKVETKFNYSAFFNAGFEAVINGEKAPTKEEFTAQNSELAFVEVEATQTVFHVEQPKAEIETVETVTVNSVFSALDHVEQEFGIETMTTVAELIDTYKNGYTNKQGKRVNALNDFPTATREQKILVLNSALEGLEQAASIEELAGILSGTILRNYIERVAYKVVTYGLTYRKTNSIKTEKAQAKHEYMNSYNQAPTANGALNSVEPADLVGEVITDAYTGDQFNTAMFESTGNVYATLYGWVHNVARRQLSQNGRSARMIKYKAADEATTDETLNLIAEMDVFTLEEKAILNMSMNGKTKREIDAIVGKRTDRVFVKMQAKYYAEKEAGNF